MNNFCFLRELVRCQMPHPDGPSYSSVSSLSLPFRSSSGVVRSKSVPRVCVPSSRFRELEGGEGGYFGNRKPLPTTSHSWPTKFLNVLVHLSFSSFSLRRNPLFSAIVASKSHSPDRQPRRAMPKTSKSPARCSHRTPQCSSFLPSAPTPSLSSPMAHDDQTLPQSDRGLRILNGSAALWPTFAHFSAVRPLEFATRKKIPTLPPLMS